MKYLLLAIIAFVVFFSSCTTNIEGSLGDDAVYYNDFETSESLGDFMFSIGFLNEDTSGSGGDSSLIVSGGCVVPHMSLELVFDNDYQLEMLIEGKVLSEFGSGYVSISTETEQTQIEVNTGDWAKYKSTPINYIAGETLNISLMSGGLIGVTTLFDNLELLEVEE